MGLEEDKEDKSNLAKFREPGFYTEMDKVVGVYKTLATALINRSKYMYENAKKEVDKEENEEDIKKQNRIIMEMYKKLHDGG